jgi:hypothetical protein
MKNKKILIFLGGVILFSCNKKNSNNNSEIESRIFKTSTIKKKKDTISQSLLKSQKKGYRDFYENDSLVLAWKNQVIKNNKLGKAVFRSEEFESYLLSIKEIKLKNIGAINIGLEDYYVEKSLAFGFSSDSLVVGNKNTKESFSFKFEKGRLKNIFFNTPKAPK